MTPRRLSPVLVALTLASIAHAHPGHGDDHDFTWDFAHMVDHPAATLITFAAVATVTWVVWRLFRRANAAADQSLRGSQASRGK